MGPIHPGSGFVLPLQTLHRGAPCESGKAVCPPTDPLLPRGSRPGQGQFK